MKYILHCKNYNTYIVVHDIVNESWSGSKHKYNLSILRLKLKKLRQDNPSRLQDFTIKL